MPEPQVDGKWQEVKEIVELLPRHKWVELIMSSKLVVGRKSRVSAGHVVDPFLGPGIFRVFSGRDRGSVVSLHYCLCTSVCT